MKEVYPGLLVGTADDYEFKVRQEEGWYVVHACKEPYHRHALGYTSRAAPRNHPEYLIARRGNRLILNLIDADDPAYIPKEIVDAALDFIAGGLRSGQHVLVHCNQGESRSPSIALLYLATHTAAIPNTSLADAEAEFVKRYPNYNPKAGIRGFLEGNWATYCRPGRAQ